MPVSLRQLFATTCVALAAALTFVVSAPVAAQEQDEALAYNTWYAASQAGDNAKSVEAAEAYLQKFPQGQYADFLSKWLGPIQIGLLNDAIKAGQVDKVIEVGDRILAKDPENLNILHAIAYQIRNKELLGNPRSFEHAKQAKDYASRAIALIDSGKTLAGVDNFDKNGTLAWLYQVEALVEENDGNEEKAIELYDKSTSLDPTSPFVAGRNLLQVLAMRQSDYSDAVNAYNALPEEARGAAEPTPEVAAALGKMNTEADALIDVSARFVALADAQGLPQSTRDKVYSVLETVYKTRNPDDTDAAGLAPLIESKK